MANLSRSDDLTTESNSIENNEMITRDSIVFNALKYICSGDIERAITMLKHFEAELADDHLSLWDIRNILGNTYSDIGDHGTALSYFQENLKNARDNLSDKFRETISLNNIGNIYKATNQYDEAIIIYKELCNKCEYEMQENFSSNYAFILKHGLISLGDTFSAKALNLMKMNQNLLSEDIEENLENALEVYRIIRMQNFDDSTELYEIYHKTADVLYYLEKYSFCIAMKKQMLELSRKLGDQKKKFRIARDLGDLHGITGHYRNSIKYYRNALIIAKKYKMNLEMASINFNLGNIYILRRRMNLAIKYHLEHLRIARLINNPKRVILALSTLANLFYSLGQYYEAKTFARELRFQSTEFKDISAANWAQTLLNDIGRIRFYATRAKKIETRKRRLAEKV